MNPAVQARLAAIRERLRKASGNDDTVVRRLARTGLIRKDAPELLYVLEALLSERDARATRYFESVKETHAADRALAKFGEEQA